MSNYINGSVGDRTKISLVMKIPVTDNGNCRKLHEFYQQRVGHTCTSSINIFIDHFSSDRLGTRLTNTVPITIMRQSIRNEHKTVN